MSEQVPGAVTVQGLSSLRRGGSYRKRYNTDTNGRPLMELALVLGLMQSNSVDIRAAVSAWFNKVALPLQNISAMPGQSDIATVVWRDSMLKATCHGLLNRYGQLSPQT